jgi:peptide chain release factor 3
LQFEVLQSRVANEYGVPVTLEQSPFELARWISADDPAKLQKFIDAHRGEIATDRDGAVVFLAESAWMLKYKGEKFPDIKFAALRERGE